MRGSCRGRDARFDHRIPNDLHAAPLWAALVDCSALLAYGTVLLAAVYYIFKNNWIWRTHQAFNNAV